VSRWSVRWRGSSYILIEMEELGAEQAPEALVRRSKEKGLKVLSRAEGHACVSKRYLG